MEVAPLAKQQENREMLLISPKADITQASWVVTTIIPFTITTQWQPAKKEKKNAAVYRSVLIAFIDRSLNTIVPAT